MHFQTGIEQFAQSRRVALFDGPEYLKHQLGIVIGNGRTLLVSLASLSAVGAYLALGVPQAKQSNE